MVLALRKDKKQIYIERTVGSTAMPPAGRRAD
jgi:hypothetical protein